MFSITRILRRATARWFLAGLAITSASSAIAQEAAKAPPGGLPTTLFPAAAEAKPAAPAVAPTVVAQPGPACAGPGCAAPAAPESCNCGGFDWKKVPEVRIVPRPGNFPIPPSGPGYYSALDMILGNCQENPPKFPYSPVSPTIFPFFDADFRYLDDPKNQQHDLIFDSLHRRHIGDNFLFSTGGEFRYRHMDEFHSRLTPVDNVYDLYRVRSYVDVSYKDILRFYVEGISAHSVGHDLAPLPIDVNRADFLNLFVDLKVATIDNHGVYVRVGRQEMLLGSERLISPLDWANTRRTFQGVKAFYQGEKFDVDAFWVQPVKIDPSKLDSVDNNQNFAGIWGTYRPEKGHSIDAYYLFLDNTNDLTQLAITRQPSTLHTIGTRYTGNKEGFLWDAEAAIQFGERGQQDVLAGMATGGLGYNFKNVPMNPTVWAYYDWASGDATPGSGNFSTFNQLFPFGHYYFGFADQVGRQNIQDANAHLYLYPTKWITLNAQYHHFMLDASHDALYNAAGNAIRRSATGAAGRDVGDELDLLANFHLDAHSDILIGYSKLFGGQFLGSTGTGIRNTDLLYVQYSFKW